MWHVPEAFLAFWSSKSYGSPAEFRAHHDRAPGKVRTEASTNVGGQLIPVVTLEAQVSGFS
jgi:hypothetical protein